MMCYRLPKIFFLCVNTNNSNKRLKQPNAKPLGCWLT